MELKCGMPVKSKAGRDKGCIYIIGDVKNEYVYLADGSSRPLCRMKKKNGKHLQPILKDGMKWPGSDEEIRKVIRNLESSEGARPQVRED